MTMFYMVIEHFVREKKTTHWRYDPLTGDRTVLPFQAGRRRASRLRRQIASWFQLANIRLTSLRLAESSQGCRAVAAWRRRRTPPA